MVLANQRYMMMFNSVTGLSVIGKYNIVFHWPRACKVIMKKNTRICVMVLYKWIGFIFFSQFLRLSYKYK